MKTPLHWRESGALAWALLPVAAVFGILATLRRFAFRRGWLASGHPGKPVVVVGNITAGGSGKTPLVIALVKLLRAHGLRAGVVSRGYGSNTQGDAERVSLVRADSDPAEVGDEPVLIARRAGCPVAVSTKRLAAARQLAACDDVDLIVTDDGLQHYALQRDIEIAVVDGVSGVGNGFLLPAGPLREPVWRLDTVDHVVVNGDEAGFDVIATGCYRLGDEHDLREPGAFASGPLHAVAGIAHPEKFFSLLRSLGLQFTAHAFPDHHQYGTADFEFEPSSGDIIMTEKDAVKCRDIAPANSWVLRIDAVLARAWSDQLLRQVTDLVAHYRGEQHV